MANENASQKKSTGRGREAGMNESHSEKSPENKLRFRGLKLNQTLLSLHPSFIQTITVGSGVAPDHAHLVILSGCEGSARGLYHRSGIHLHTI